METARLAVRGTPEGASRLGDGGGATAVSRLMPTPLEGLGKGHRLVAEAGAPTRIRSCTAARLCRETAQLF